MELFEKGTYSILLGGRGNWMHFEQMLYLKLNSQPSLQTLQLPVFHSIFNFCKNIPVSYKLYPE